MDFKESINVTGQDERSTFRSLNGYASEYMAIGRALQAGYIVSFRAYRDAPYDAVIDYDGTLYRAEIKGTRTTSIAFTSGGRAGRQIDKNAENREHIVKTEDCEFVIGIYGINGSCYIVPTEILKITEKGSWTLNALEPFKEKWKIFMGSNDFTPEEIRRGFQSKSTEELVSDCNKLGLQRTEGNKFPWPGVQGKALQPKGRNGMLIMDIWKHLYSNI